MSRRLLLVMAAFGTLGLAAAWDAPGIGRSGAVLVVLLVETLALFVACLARLVSAPALGLTLDARPADGLVPFVGLSGVEGFPNEVDPSIRHFARLATAAPGEAGRRRRTHGPLLGRVGLFSIFVGRDGSGWSDQEVVEAFDSLVRMGRWVEREAGRWGTPVNLEIVDTCFRGNDPEPEVVELTLTLDPYRNILDEADTDVRGIASASRAVSALGFADLADLIARVDPRADHDRTVWFVHLMRAGRSSAVAADRFRYPGVGLALCYARESAASGPLVGLPYVDPATLAHELLHLFGASDKYGTSLRSFPERSVTSRDIMRLDHDRLGALRIDGLTASEIGWAPPGATRAENRPASTRA